MTSDRKESIPGIFEVIYEDETKFIGGTILNPMWGRVSSEKKIKSLSLRVSSTSKVVLENFESYNFLVGGRIMINSNKPEILHVYGLGCRKGIVTSYRITVISDSSEKYKTGDITVRTFPFGKEGVGRTPTSGWK